MINIKVMSESCLSVVFIIHNNILFTNMEEYSENVATEWAYTKSILKWLLIL